MIGTMTGLLLAAAVPLKGAELPPDGHPTHFDTYTEAYQAAQKSRQPLLVILNPPRESDGEPLSLDDVQKTRQRRDLLKNYVVAVIDTGTEQGETAHKLFGEPPLPRVVVIDKRQQYKIFKTSQPMYGQVWTDVLQRYRNGERPARRVRVTAGAGYYSQPGIPQFSQPGGYLPQGGFCRT